MCFKPKKMTNLYIPQVRLNGKVLKWFAIYKYLGIMIRDDSNDEADINRHKKGVYTRGNHMISKFKNCTDDVKICLFKTYFTSMYGSVLWCNYRQTSLTKAKVAYNDIYRGLFNVRRGESVSMLYVFSRINSFDVIVRKYVYSFQQRLQESCNCIIKSIVGSSFHCTSLLVSKWNRILYL